MGGGSVILRPSSVAPPLCLHGGHLLGLAGLLPGPGNLALSLPDERDRVQKKTFTKWVNKHLIKVGGMRTHGCEHVCRSACVCVCVCVRVCVCAGSRGGGGCPGGPSQTRAGAPSASTCAGPPFCPGGPPPTSEPVLSVCFLPWLAHLLSLSSSSSSSWSLLVSLALEGRGRCLLGGGRLLWAPYLEPSGPAPHSVRAGSEAHQ